MGWLDKIIRRDEKRFIIDPSEFGNKVIHFWREWLDGDGNPQFSQAQAYVLAKTLAEVYFPIDLIADRVSTLRYNVVNTTGEIVEKPDTAVQRLIGQPNVLCNLSTLMYNAVFNLLSDGNLVGVRSSSKNTRKNKAIERQNTGRRFKEFKDRSAFRK